ncbi:hypothetical protein A3A79_05075 [Candidatus Gottesmanbacteria bacterium RIFCSPLOWO2_01_FULL_43_11b]|uniref:Uncharacterized protein n=1 Tax=Candidatus Gottesmanbacteria bacterium RIFCSPLOWO2_01_FULL_43_11b TaxID=1798392 RepID=A0A1F6AJW1_9BACT|nr:MAG: hypothetical protein A3A79_05075 [Candidatus Gottesmanbacteria bacterium RIFCSPLOWO2_01_FULL_43_11b]
MKSRLNQAQLKALSDFANTVAAAWFSGGVISLFFAQTTSLLEMLRFPLIGVLMTWFTLRWSLSLLEGVKR